VLIARSIDSRRRRPVPGKTSTRVASDASRAAVAVWNLILDLLCEKFVAKIRKKGPRTGRKGRVNPAVVYVIVDAPGIIAWAQRPEPRDLTIRGLGVERARG
jgi:hypothetical protein